MKKILILLAFVMVFGVSSIVFAAEEEQAMVKEVQEEILMEEETTTEETVVEEVGCPHTWGEWTYDLTEHNDGSITHFRYCSCGVYEELDVETYCDSGGQYDDCEKGRHNWCEDGYCEECGCTEEL